MLFYFAKNLKTGFLSYVSLSFSEERVLGKFSYIIALSNTKNSSVNNSFLSKENWKQNESAVFLSVYSEENS